MLTTILEVAALLAIILLPMGGPPTKKKKNITAKIDRDTTNAHYAVNKDGYLEERHARELSHHEH